MLTDLILIGSTAGLIGGFSVYIVSYGIASNLRLFKALSK